MRVILEIRENYLSVSIIYVHSVTTGSERHKLSAKMNGSLHTCTCSHVVKPLPLHSLTLLCPFRSWIDVQGRGWGRVISPYTRSTGMPYGPSPLKE